MVVIITPDLGEKSNGKEENRFICIVTLNVGTMSVEMLSKRQIDICCEQESRWRGESAQKITGRNLYYKFFWRQDNSGNAGLRVLVAKHRLIK